MAEQFTVPTKGFPYITKDPDAVLDYIWDWSAWLKPGETLVTRDVAVEAGSSVVDSATIVGATVVAWISGGTLDEDAEVRCRISTNEGRIDDRTVKIKIRRR